MRSKSIISSSVGNVLEWYDFGLFAIYSPLFSQLFFPNKDHSAALLATFSIFAVGFICRPIGALLFGFLGDRGGRVQALRLSILMISIPTLLIGLLPTYSQCGIVAPILLMLIRVWQGISLGGEYSGNLIYLAETAPNKYRATVTALAGTGANFGILLASCMGGVMSYLFSETVFHAWAWRLPYIISGILCLLIYATRLQMQETHVFEHLKIKHQLVRNPLKVMIKENMPQVLRTLGLVCMGSTFYYFCFVYVPIFLMQREQFSLFKAANFMAVFMAAMLVLVPLAGRLCDYVGRRKMLLCNALLVTIIVVPGFYILQKNQLSLMLLVMAFFTIASSLEQGTTSIAVVENYPVPARYTGLSFGYNIGNGLFGGTVPLVCEWLLMKTHSELSPAFYIMGCAIVTGLVAFFFTKETKNSSLG
jgi:MHS family proline/betaine transporter-like MFS transporter